MFRNVGRPTGECLCEHPGENQSIVFRPTSFPVATGPSTYGRRLSAPHRRRPAVGRHVSVVSSAVPSPRPSRRWSIRRQPSPSCRPVVGPLLVVGCLRWSFRRQWFPVPTGRESDGRPSDPEES